MRKRWRIWIVLLLLVLAAGMLSAGCPGKGGDQDRSRDRGNYRSY